MAISDNGPKKQGGKGCLVALLLLATTAATPFAWRSLVKTHYQRSIYTVEDVPPDEVAIVFGAAVFRSGRLSTVLRDRMDTAIDLYRQGQVQRLLLSGDGGSDHYDEPDAMMAYAITQGVAPEDIEPDYAGRRTYDSCYRAYEVFGVQSAILVTQEFHLPRALFTCRRLGLTSVGVAADLHRYRAAGFYEMRETLATLVALWDVTRRAPAAVIGTPLPRQ